MLKRIIFIFTAIFISLMMFGCADASGETLPDQNNQQDNDPQESNNDGVPSEEAVNEDQNDEDPVLDESVVAQGSLESRETNEHIVVIDTAGVYDIYTVSSFDSAGVISTIDGDRIKGNLQKDDFLITVFLEPDTYKIEVSGFSQNEFGDYNLHVKYREDLVDVHYYVIDKVNVGGMNEHEFTVTVAGNYRIVGDSEINIVGTLYRGDNYVTNDYDSGLGFTIELHLEPGVYSINVNGFQWLAANYEVFIYLG